MCIYYDLTVFGILAETMLVAMVNVSKRLHFLEVLGSSVANSVSMLALHVAPVHSHSSAGRDANALC